MAEAWGISSRVDGGGEEVGVESGGVSGEGCDVEVVIIVDDSGGGDEDLEGEVGMSRGGGGGVRNASEHWQQW